jgi:hypothetical protein
MCKDEIGKTSLWTDTIELVLVLWIHLKSKTYCKRKKNVYTEHTEDLQETQNKYDIYLETLYEDVRCEKT